MTCSELSGVPARTDVTNLRACIKAVMVRTFLGTCLLFLSLAISGVAQSGPSEPCSFSDATHMLFTDGSTFLQGVKSSPRNAVRPQNLAWEVPIGVTAGILIAKGDRPAADRIQSSSLRKTAGRWSNVGIFTELGAGALAWGIGCKKHNSKVSEAGFTALAATGAAAVTDLGLKLAFNREFPTTSSRGEFWEGGRSFPSGHSATSFAFASTVAHRYPHNKWVKWGAYALASGVSLSRYPAKKHFPSDILVGATLGYVTGAYIADHTPH
jgi:membrane-associated phospholipid phosphatase